MSANISYENALQGYQGTLDLIAQEYPQADLNEIKKHLIDISQMNKDERVPASIVAQNALTLARYLDEPLLGLKVVDRYDWSLIPIVKLLMRQFPPEKGKSYVGEMIIFLSGYLSTVTEAVNIHLTWTQDQLRLEVTPYDETILEAQIEGIIYGISDVLFLMTRCRPLKVNFRHANQTSVKEYQSYFKVAPVFKSEKYRLVYEAKPRFNAIDEVSINTVAGLNLLLQDEFPELDPVQKCRIILRSTLHFGEPSRERVAGFLHMSLSTFKRKLKAKGTTFKDILRELRKETAINILVEQNLTAADAAFLTGYQSETQFYRAFKTWFGMTSAELKDQHLKSSQQN